MGCAASSFGGYVLDESDPQNRVGGIKVYIMESGDYIEMATCWTDSSAQFSFSADELNAIKKDIYYDIGCLKDGIIDPIVNDKYKNILGKKIFDGLGEVFIEAPFNGIISGHLSDEDGMPVISGSVSIRDQGYHDVIATRFVDGLGDFKFESLEIEFLKDTKEKYFTLRIASPGFVPAEIIEVPVSRGGETIFPDDYIVLHKLVSKPDGGNTTRGMGEVKTILPPPGLIIRK